MTKFLVHAALLIAHVQQATDNEYKQDGDELQQRITGTWISTSTSAAHVHHLPQ